MAAATTLKEWVYGATAIGIVVSAAAIRGHTISGGEPTHGRWSYFIRNRNFEPGGCRTGEDAGVIRISPEVVVNYARTA